MDSLPVEVVEVIARLLTSSELAACAAVSRGWRRVFDHDILWSPRCIAALEEPLRTTPCIVDPPFVDPAPEDSSLGPVGRWRLAYMRETHLWNNWRRDNHKVASIPSERGDFLFFTSNDTVVKLFHRNLTRGLVLTFQLYDVRTLEPTLLSESTIEHDDVSFNKCFYKHERIFITCNVINEPKHKKILVYGIDRTAGNIIGLRFQIGLNPRHFRIIRAIGTRTAILFFARIVESGSPCPILDDSSSMKLLIWDLEQGTELKIENFPPVSPSTFKQAFNSKTCDDVVIVSLEVKNHTKRYHFHIYNVAEMKYLPFTQVFESDKRLLGCICIIHLCYIGIKINASIKIFNYHSQNLLFEVNLPKNSVFFEVIDDCFMFFVDPRLVTFHPPSRTLEVLFDFHISTLHYDSCSCIKMIGDSVIQLDKYMRVLTEDPNDYFVQLSIGFLKVKRHNVQELPQIWKFQRPENVAFNLSFTRSIREDLHKNWTDEDEDFFECLFGGVVKHLKNLGLAELVYHW